ncbi:MFS transporter [Sphingobium scionense]
MDAPGHPFRYRDFRYFWAARICAMLAHSGLVVTLGWAVYDEARLSMGIRAAALRLGLIGLVQFLPILALSPVTGLTADRFDRRVVVRAALLGQWACPAVLTLLAFGPGANLYALYLAAALFAGARAFYQPAMNALPPALVPPAALPQAIAVTAIAGRIGAISGPMLGGVAYAIGQGWAFALSAALLAVAIGLHLCIRPIVQKPLVDTRGPLAQMLDGFHYVMTNRLLLGAISLDMFAVLLGGTTALLPIFARDVLHSGPEGLGLLRAASSIGALGTAAFLSWRRSAAMWAPGCCGRSDCSAGRPSALACRAAWRCRWRAWRSPGRRTWCRSISASRWSNWQRRTTSVAGWVLFPACSLPAPTNWARWNQASPLRCWGR